MQINAKGIYSIAYVNGLSSVLFGKLNCYSFHRFISLLAILNKFQCRKGLYKSLYAKRISLTAQMFITGSAFI